GLFQDCSLSIDINQRQLVGVVLPFALDDGPIILFLGRTGAGFYRAPRGNMPTFSRAKDPIEQRTYGEEHDVATGKWWGWTSFGSAWRRKQNPRSLPIGR